MEDNKLDKKSFKKLEYFQIRDNTSIHYLLNTLFLSEKAW